MAGIRLLVLCSVVAAASCQGGRGSPTFCLELLKSENKQDTAQAVVKCAGQVRKRVENSGGRFQLKEHYSSIGRCIAENVGLVSRDGFVNKPALMARVRNSRKITQVERDYYLGLVPTCETWDTCLTQHCKL